MNNYTRRGSQIRQRIEDSEYVVDSIRGKRLVTRYADGNGPRQVWQQNDQYSGFVLVVEGEGYEFVSSFLPKGN